MNSILSTFDEAISLIENIPPTDNLTEIHSYFARRFVNGYNPKRIEVQIPRGSSERVHRNLIIIAGLIYFVSGKHPDEIWGEDALGERNILSLYKDCNSEYYFSSSSLNIPSKMKILNDKSLLFFEHGLKGLLTEKLLGASKLKNANIAEFLTEGFILKDSFFVAKSYDEIKWAELFKSERANCEKKDEPKVESHEICKAWELHAVTMEGNNHKKCDDYSLVTKIDNDAWFCCSADGVGSSPDSHIGSRLAAVAFETRIREAYLKLGSTERLMGYIQFSLAKDAVNLWIKYIWREIGKKEISLSNYATTLLFTFYCKKFVVCGRVGDGNFIVEKRESLSGEKYGYFTLTDGYSGVVQSSVLSVAHLLRNPHAMQLSFFSPDEISGIIMASDGANALMYKNIDGVLFPHFEDLTAAAEIMSDLRDESFEERKGHLRGMCAKYSSSNKYSGGRGDDCTIVYVKHRRA